MREEGRVMLQTGLERRHKPRSRQKLDKASETFALEPLGGVGPPSTLISNCRPPDPQQNKFLVV